MSLTLSGLNTGLMGYTLRKDFLGNTLFYRETEVYSYEINSTLTSGSVSGFSPSLILQAIYKAFSGTYSGDYNVKVFQAPAEYSFPNDAVRNAKFNVEVESRRIPTGLSGLQPELTTNYYKGLDTGFFNSYGTGLKDFQEDFAFEQDENGNQAFNHNLSFVLISGSRGLATQIASGIFANDSNTTFGISAMVGGAIVANTGVFQNYFTETYDTIKNSYSFVKKRLILPITGDNYVYDLKNTLDMKEDGVMDVNEHASVKGKLNFTQAQNGLATLLSGSYNRCNTFYTTYASYAGNFPVSLSLINFPLKTVQVFNRPALTAEYDITYTNNPTYQSNQTMVEEIIDFNVDNTNVVDLKHRFNFEINRRNPQIPGFMNLIANALEESPAVAGLYYANSNFYSAAWPLNQIKQEIATPLKNPKSSMTLYYSNHPRNLVTINGVLFNKMEYHIENKRPEDITTEYKVVNRPNNLSILNYAYQTQKGAVSITFDANIGRNPNEFSQGFRTNVGTYLYPLYKYGVSLFMQQFANVIPISFTYFISDASYKIDSDGVLQLTLNFTYTLKKYIL